jgi:hypothetical protein
MSGVGIHEMATLGFEDGVEAGDEHVLRDVSDQRGVDPSQHVPRRVGGLGDGTEHAAGAGHHQRCRHSLAGSVAHHHSQPTFREKVEVVEVSSHFPGRLVVGSNLPTF